MTTPDDQLREEIAAYRRYTAKLVAELRSAGFSLYALKLWAADAGVSAGEQQQVISIAGRQVTEGPDVE